MKMYLLRLTPEGIQGEPEVPYSAFIVSENNGREALVQVNTGPISKVYLRRVVRQDETGIWSVTGYDPR